MVVKLDLRLPRPHQVAAEVWALQRPAVEAAWAHQVVAARPLPEEAIRPRYSAVQKSHLLPAKPEPHPEAVEAPLCRVMAAQPLQVEAAAWVPQAVPGQPRPEVEAA